MRIHTDVFRADKVRDALHAEITAGRIAPSVTFKTLQEHASRTHSTGIEIQLEAWEKLPGDGRRYGNSGSYGAGEHYAPTYDEWGWLLSALYRLDPRMLVGSMKYPLYTDATDFHERTGYTYHADLATRIATSGDPYPYRKSPSRALIGRRGYGRSRVAAYWTKQDPRTAEWAQNWIEGKVK